MVQVQPGGPYAIPWQPVVLPPGHNQYTCLECLTMRARAALLIEILYRRDTAYRHLRTVDITGAQAEAITAYLSRPEIAHEHVEEACLCECCDAVDFVACNAFATMADLVRNGSAALLAFVLASDPTPLAPTDTEVIEAATRDLINATALHGGPPCKQ